SVEIQFASEEKRTYRPSWLIDFGVFALALMPVPVNGRAPVGRETSVVIDAEVSRRKTCWKSPSLALLKFGALLSNAIFVPSEFTAGRDESPRPGSPLAPSARDTRRVAPTRSVRR